MSNWVLRVGAATDVGRVRETNEDAHVVATLGQPSAALEDGQELTFEPSVTPVLLAVSDGMGGAAAGEVASALAIEALRRALPADSHHWDTTLRDAVQQANREVRAAAQVPSRRGMGATLTAVCVHGHEAHIAEVGDSRAYLFRGGMLTLLTHDQTYVQMLVDNGEITEEEAARSPLRSIIVSAMGQKKGFHVALKRLKLLPGDKLLVCCDGLSNELTAEEMRGVLAADIGPNEACVQLVALANERGGNDNITALVAEVRGLPHLRSPAP